MNPHLIPGLMSAVDRLLRAMPRNPDVLAVKAALDAVVSGRLPAGDAPMVAPPTTPARPKQRAGRANPKRGKKR